jgi:general secretion pathway protein D
MGARYMRRASPILLSLSGASFLLSGCATQTFDKDAAFALSSEHLQQTQTAKASHSSAVVPPIPAIAPMPLITPVVGGARDKTEALYTLSVMKAPVRQVMHKLSRDAKVNLDIDQDVVGNITINAIDQPLKTILARISDQLGCRIQITPDLISVQADKPQWVSYPIDYVNLDRYSSSSIMLSNAVGSSTARQAQAMTLGGGNTTPTATSVQSGSNVAILNQSRSDVWAGLTLGVQRILRSMYPMLSAESSTNAVMTPANTTASASAEVSAQALSSLSSKQMPSAESLLPVVLERSSDKSPYPDGASVMNYVHVSREAGFISVFAPHKAQREIQQLVDMTMAGTRRQVLIEATVVEVELNDENQAGINWNMLADNATFGLTSSYTGRDQIEFTNASTAGMVTMTGNSITKDFSLATTIKLLQRFGNSKVLSSPKLVTINNQPSLLKVVKNLVYFSMQVQVIAGQTGQSSTRAYTSVPNTVPVGLVMSVLPSINAHNEITLVVRPTISSLSGTVDDPNPDLGSVPNRVPIIQEREMESVLKLQDGQIAILGGLIQDVQADEDTGVPGLVGLPAMGYVFGQKNAAKRKSELVVFLRPTVVRSPDVEQGDLRQKQHLLPKQSRFTPMTNQQVSA